MNNKFESIAILNSRDQHKKHGIPLFCASTTHLTNHNTTLLEKWTEILCIVYAMITTYLR